MFINLPHVVCHVININLVIFISHKSENPEQLLKIPGWVGIKYMTTGSAGKCQIAC